MRQPGADRGLPRAPVPAGDADLVAEDVTAVLREWSGHEYQAARDAQLAEALAASGDAVRALGAGRTDWLPGALALPAVARAAAVNLHDGVQWLGKEDLEAYLQVLAIEALVSAPDTGDAAAARRLTTLLDARALVLAAAARAGWRVDALCRALAGPTTA